MITWILCICLFLQSDDDCCNSCEDVREAYRKKGWALSNPDLIDQVCPYNIFTLNSILLLSVSNMILLIDTYEIYQCEQCSYFQLTTYKYGILKGHNFLATDILHIRLFIWNSKNYIYDPFETISNFKILIKILSTACIMRIMVYFSIFIIEETSFSHTHLLYFIVRSHEL